MSAEDAAEALALDPARFQGEGGDLTLLYALRKAEQAVEAADEDILRKAIQPLHAFFLSLLLPSSNPSSASSPTATTTPSGLPKPGRPLRHLVARILVTLHRRVESRSLFDFIQAILKALQDGAPKNMSQVEGVQRVAGWEVVGEVMRDLGTNMMSFMGDITLAAVKVLRNANLPVVLRVHAVQAFSKSLVSAGRALQEGLIKDLLKALRAGLSDKALPVQRAVADAFIALNLFTTATPLAATLDSVAPLIIKSFESTDYLTRRSLSRLLAHLLARTQEPGSGAPVAEPARKGKSAGEDIDGNEPNVITSAPEDKSGRTLLNTMDMLRYISVPYNKPNTPRRVRNALIDVYAGLFTQLGGVYIEGHYAEITRHLMDELVLAPRAQSTRYEVLSARESMAILLRDLIGTRLLSESAQVMAIREWANGYLSKWSLTPLPGQANASKSALIVALKETAGLLEQLGNAPAQILELLADPLVRLLSHDSHSVRVAASATLRTYCASNPSQLPRLLDVLLVDLDKELNMLGTPAAPKEIAQRVMGKAYALAALVSLTSNRPLYVSHDIPTRVFDLATSLLKKSGDADVRTSGVQVQVAWYLIAALMSLGPGFVKMHLPQLLVLWRNALPKPTSKDSTVGERGEAEWSFLLLVRECTLSAVLNFLRHNALLLNIDVARRLATLFTNSLNFVNGFATAYAEALREQAAINAGAQQASASGGTSALFASRAGDGVSLVEREANLRRRVLQCFTALGSGSSGHSATESMQGALLQAAITVFADPENYAGSGGASATQQAIAAQSGQFTNVWAATDGYAFGLTSGMKSREVEGEEREEGYLNRDKIEMAIECQLTRPINTALEHDFLDLLSTAAELRSAPPAQTGVIDAGVDLFATLFAQQNAEGMVQSLGTLSSNARSSKLERNPGRRQAVVANTVCALRRALSAPDASGQRARKALGSQQVADLVKNILQDAVLDPQAVIRQAAAECMGLLAGIASGSYLSTQVQWLVDQVVKNRIPESRAGCALAFGSIYSAVGGLAGGPILKTIVNILMSLATDPHPVVHFWAMVALAQVVNAANLSYEPFVPNTLGMLSSIYLMETHEPEGGSLGSVNLRGDLPAYQVILRILHALIGVIGPELQEPGKIRSLVFLLVHEFGEESDEGLAVEAIKCVQQFLMFAPNEVDVPALLAKFRVALASSRRPRKGATITALYQIVQRDAVLISKLGGNQLVEDLFGLLDDDPSLEGVKNVITAWLGQTAAALPGGWIDLCQRIMTRTAAAAAAAKANSQAAALSGKQQSQFMDDEGEGFAGDAGSASANASSGLSSRWRTQLFALQCLHDIIRAVLDSGRREHIDANLARQLGVNTRQMLYSRVADLIRMAFSASAAQVVQVRLQGLVVLRDVIEAFASSPDPDFEGSSSLLLEQHQAPIAAALTPSFGKDAPPEVVALAVRVCATFVGCGVVKEVGRMGRVLRLLSNALEQCKDGANLSLGDVDNLSTNAAVMLKVSVLTAWAELQVASTKQAYLVDVVNPYRWLLGPLWIGALRDYALLRTDPEMGAGMDVAGFAGMSRDVLLPYYEQSIPKLLHAISIALAASDAFALGAMDGQTFSSAAQQPNLPAVRPDSSPSFYVIYGLSFETLVKAMGDSSTAPLASVALNAMVSLVRPLLSGTGIFNGAFFDELITVAYRIGMSEPATVKAEVMGVLSSFVTSRAGQMVVDQAQVRRCLAVVIFTLRQAISSTEAKSTFSPSDDPADRATCIKNGFTAFMRIVEAIPEPSERADLMVVAIHLYGDLIKDESHGMAEVAAASLPVLKQLVDAVLEHDKDQCKETAGKAVHGLCSSMLTNVDDMRSRVTSAANVKIKNNLLALTLILTTLPTTVPLSRPLVESVADTVAAHLGSNADRPELGLTAVHCASTLLASSLRPLTHPALGHAIIAMIPGMITFLSESVVSVAAALDEAGGDPSTEVLRSMQSTSEAVREAIKALVTWCQSVEVAQKPRVYAVLLPTMGLLLDRDGESGNGQTTRTPLHAVGAAALLGLAQTSPAAFKDAMAAMEPEERGRLEKGLRGAVGGQQSQVAAGFGGKKGIELRSFG